MKIGYKGTNKDMMCKGATQFELGKTYYLNHDNKIEILPDGYTIVALKNKIELCSENAIHYCNELKDVFNFYSHGGTNRFFKVEVIGEYIEDNTKSGARCIRFIEEVSKEELEETIKLKDEKYLDVRMHIEEVKTLQTLNPHLIIGGSIALYLHGVRLARFKSTTMIDYDFILPFYQHIQGDEKIHIENNVSYQDNADEYGFDFGMAIRINMVKGDVRIDPMLRYELIEYKGFTYKVNSLINIIQAKAKYSASKWGDKHRHDLIEMILKK